MDHRPSQAALHSRYLPRSSHRPPDGSGVSRCAAPVRGLLLPGELRALLPYLHCVPAGSAALPRELVYSGTKRWPGLGQLHSSPSTHASEGDGLRHGPIRSRCGPVEWRGGALWRQGLGGWQEPVDEGELGDDDAPRTRPQPGRLACEPLANKPTQPHRAWQQPRVWELLRSHGLRRHHRAGTLHRSVQEHHQLVADGHLLVSHQLWHLPHRPVRCGNVRSLTALRNAYHQGRRARLLV